MSKKWTPTPFKAAVIEYYDMYLKGRLTMEDVSLVLRRNKKWLSNYVAGNHGIPAEVLFRLYKLMPELMEDVESGAIAQPVVRESGSQVKKQHELKVTIEGKTGAGKTSMASLIAEALAGSGVDVTVSDSGKGFDLENALANLESIGGNVQVVVKN